MIKNVAMTDEEILISCLNDLINLWSKHFSEEKIKTWLKLHLLCCIRCENYSFEDKLIIVW
jgi:hypothetical protein